jgi:hypothetical protein
MLNTTLPWFVAEWRYKSTNLDCGTRLNWLQRSTPPVTLLSERKSLVAMAKTIVTPERWVGMHDVYKNFTIAGRGIYIYSYVRCISGNNRHERILFFGIWRRVPKHIKLSDSTEQPYSGFIKNNNIVWRMASSGMLCRVALVRPDVSKDRIASIIRVTKIGVFRKNISSK